MATLRELVEARERAQEQYEAAEARYRVAIRELEQAEVTEGRKMIGRIALIEAKVISVDEDGEAVLQLVHGWIGGDGGNDKVHMSARYIRNS